MGPTLTRIGDVRYAPGLTARHISPGRPSRARNYDAGDSMRQGYKAVGKLTGFARASPQAPVRDKGS